MLPVTKFMDGPLSNKSRGKFPERMEQIERAHSHFNSLKFTKHHRSHHSNDDFFPAAAAAARARSTLIGFDCVAAANSSRSLISKSIKLILCVTKSGPLNLPDLSCQQN